MNFARDLSTLRRYVILVQAGALLIALFGFVSVMLFVDPALVGVPKDSAGAYRGNWVWHVTGAVFVVFAGVCIVVAGRWSRRLVWVFANVKPELMRLRVEVETDSEATNYYAVLSGEARRVEDGPVWRVPLYSPGWDVGALREKAVTAKVYFDPRTQKPAVVEAEGGVLWAMGAAVQRSTWHATSLDHG